jgi:hypothetical protein
MIKVLANRITAIQQALMAQYQGGVAMANAAKGSERELFLREYLQKVFPSYNRFSSGVIIDYKGNQTGQIDIAIEQPFSPSFPMPASDSSRLLLAESVAAVIEVKSDVAKQWDQACRTIAKVRPLKRQFKAMFGFGNATAEIPCIAVGYKGFRDARAIGERLSKTDESSRPNAVLSIETGAFVGGGISASDWAGVYALCTYLNTCMRSIASASVDMLSYVRG